MGVACCVRGVVSINMAAYRLGPMCSLGVASARHVSGLKVKGKDSKYLFDAPLGPSVIRWDLEKGERTRQYQVSTPSKY